MIQGPTKRRLEPLQLRTLLVGEGRLSGNGRHRPSPCFSRFSGALGFGLKSSVGPSAASRTVRDWASPAAGDSQPNQQHETGTWARSLPSGHLGSQRLWVAAAKSSRWGEDGLAGRRHDWLPRTPIQAAPCLARPAPSGHWRRSPWCAGRSETVPTRQRRPPMLPRVAGSSQAGSATRHRAAVRP